MRKKEKLAPGPAISVMTISKIDKETMVPSSWFHPSAQ